MNAKNALRKLRGLAYHEPVVKMRALALAFVVSLMSCLSAFGKAYFFTQSELVEKAAVIAIVRLAEPEDAKPAGGKNVDPFAAEGVQGKFWNYSRQAKVHVEKVLKGRSPDDFIMYGEESFICASCHLAKGRFLAFLTKDGDLWAGVNWQLSLRPIRDDEVEWYASGEQRYPMEFQKLDKVIAQIQKELTKQDAVVPSGAQLHPKSP